MLWASETNNLPEVKKLLSSNPCLVNVHDMDGYTPLHRAAYGNHLQMAEVRELLTLLISLTCTHTYNTVCLSVFSVCLLQALM